MAGLRLTGREDWLVDSLRIPCRCISAAPDVLGLVVAPTPASQVPEERAPGSPILLEIPAAGPAEKALIAAEKAVRSASGLTCGTFMHESSLVMS